MAYATLRFYAELNDFLPAQRRQRDWTLAFEPPSPARHLIESCGVPHTEVELILHEGAYIGLEAPVGDGDRLAVYPMFESCDVRPLLRLRPRPLRRLRFRADAHLGAWHDGWGCSALIPSGTMTWGTGLWPASPLSRTASCLPATADS